MYRLIASDLDETLIPHNRILLQKDIDAIQKAREKGVRFVCASGRGYLSMQGTLKSLGLYDAENQYTISFNGGAITENKDNRLLSFKGISYEKAEQLFLRGLAYDVCIHVYTIDTVYVYRLTEDEINYLNNRMEVTEFFTPDISFLKDQKLVKVLYVNTDYDYLKKIDNDLKDISYDCDVSYSSNRYLEFNAKGVNKGEGLKELASLLNIDISECIAAGDNINDLSMIQAAGLGIGVANTVEEMKPLCDHITKATCDEGAMAEIIEEFILNQ